MSQELMIRHDAPSESEFGIMLQQAQMLVKTNFLPQAIKSPEQALAIMLTGRELGIPAMAALNTINVIQGKPTISPQLMLALIERSGQLEDIRIQPKNSTNGTIDYVSCTMKRKGRSDHTEIFGMLEAVRLQLNNKDNYKKQPATMFKWRAVAACARVVFPDVILGLYTPDEMGAEVTETGEVGSIPEFEKTTNTVVRMPSNSYSEDIQNDIAEASMENTKVDYSNESTDGFPANPIARSLSDLVTAKQLGMIRAFSREIGIDPDTECQTVMQCKTDELSKKAASALIQHLQDLQKKADYSAEWDEKLSSPTVTAQIQPADSSPVEASKVSPETKGRLLAEAGAVGRNAAGYTVSDNIDGQAVIFQITKTGNVINHVIDR